MWCKRVVQLFVVCSICVHAVVGQEPPAKPKAKVELRWLETKRIEGLTEDQGIQYSCDPEDLVYLHKKPALVLSSANVAKAQLNRHDIALSNVPRAHYLVELHLTKEGREKLAASYEGKEMRLLCVVVDGKKCGGVQRYEKDKSKKFVPDACWAETFVPEVRYFFSKDEAERLVEAVK